MTSKRVQTGLLILLTALLPAAAFADGGGGFFFGSQTASYPFLPGLPVQNSSPGLDYVGGYGYGGSGHEISGGFGVGFSRSDDPAGTAGGYGGVIYGVRGLLGPVNIMLTSWTGIGGIRVYDPASGGGRGYLLFTEEIDLEIGLPIVRWFMPTFYAGYQVAGSLCPQEPFRGYFSYTPVVGVRFAWGGFY